MIVTRETEILRGRTVQGPFCPPNILYLLIRNVCTLQNIHIHYTTCTPKCIFYKRLEIFSRINLTTSEFVFTRSLRQVNLFTVRLYWNSNETPTWRNTVQVLFLQSHSTCFGRKRPSSGVLKLVQRPLVHVLHLIVPDGCIRSVQFSFDVLVVVYLSCLFGIAKF